MRLTFLILALIFFVRNCLLPLAADDYSYAFVWDGAGRGNILEGVPDTIERVDSIGDLIASQWSHYMTWGGRTPAHTLIQLFVWLGKPLFDVLNTAMFVALIVLIARLADVRLTLRNLLWITLGLWVATPEWISTMEWLTGACNYLWMGVVQLLFLKFFSTSINRLIMIPLGLMAGWSNEAGGLATLFIAVALMIGQQKIRSAHRIGLLSFALGYALLILAPGNFNRLALTQPNFSLTTAVLVEHLSPFVEVISQQLLLLVPLVIVFSRRGASSSIKIFTAAGLLVPTVMMFSPAFPLRSCFMSTIFLLIASTAALDRLNIDPKKYFKPLIAIGIVWALSVAGSLYSDISIRRQMDHRFELINELSAEPLLKVPPLNPTWRLEKILGLRIFGSAAMSIGGELSDNPREGHNVTFAKYHGIKAIAVER
ncbi:MAG: hypothetical protein IJ668_10645 [Selenomonadaceae bacterium]|nr:hypothetical protein [Selenomonadaceae bacterium]